MWTVSRPREGICHLINRKEGRHKFLDATLEGEKEFRVLMDLPGVPHENLDLSIEDQTLLVKAERTESVPEGFEARRSERAGHVTFSRTFSLGNSVNVDGIEAKFSNGVLTITLPKSEKSLPRRIEVQ